MKTFSLAVSIFALAWFAHARHPNVPSTDYTFVPPNSLQIPVTSNYVGGIDEDQFNEILDKIERVFANKVEETGRKLVVDRRWEDPTFNAFAHQKTPGVDTIVMYGGLARHKDMTADAMALVACHELGHHLGGAPKKKDDDTSKPRWSSNEGQADYWGSMKCLREYFKDEDNAAALKFVHVPSIVESKCQGIYSSKSDVLVCKRVAMAGFSLGKVLNSLYDGKIPVSFFTPDKIDVQVTIDEHPMAQCRLDTYFQAALCDHDLSDAISDTDPNIGVCSQEKGDVIGFRPSCWYKALP